MLPLTLLAPQKIVDLLLAGASFARAVEESAQENVLMVPPIADSQITISSASPELADLVNQFTYPRMCIYSGALRNEQVEKFRSLSGSITVTSEIWSSGNMLSDTDRWIHFYVDAFTRVMGNAIGDLGDGFFFPGKFDIQFQQPKRGGFGYLQMAKISCNLLVSR